MIVRSKHGALPHTQPGKLPEAHPLKEGVTRGDGPMAGSGGAHASCCLQHFL